MTNKQMSGAVIAVTCVVLMVVLTPVALRSDRERQPATITEKSSSVKKQYTRAEVSFLAGTGMVANVKDRTSVSKPERVSVGYQACASLKRGFAQGDVIDSLGYRYDFADVLVAAAYEDLCPEIPIA
ncbi:DUF732 domain-containing protein [Streptomyces sp. TS71-3]|uniref:DUF732 domain-containing protein n=1 Tax=Streptomyces sp. TS71-3 TaxID=2733862 RepID=UPI001B2379B1|nr:DUF732 domain-containing protein [Streptomyces sp. TS71-3]GHJ40881.1 hypothetical protein Sm713_64900 [Streptomyces sp. TS71-3]